MNVLIVCTSISWGGLEQTALRDALELKKRGIDIHILGMDSGALFEKAKGTDVSYHSIRSQNKYLNFELTFKIRNIIKEFGIHVIHMHTFNTVFPVLLAVKRMNVKVVATRHIHVEHVKKDFFHRWYLNRLDRLFAISDFARKNLVETYPLPAEKVQTLYIGINVGQFERTPGKQEQFKKDFPYIPSDSRIVGVVGRIDPMKGQLEFIEAIPAILTRHPNTYFVIVGRPTSENENKYLEFIKYRAKQLGVEDFITYTGFYNDVSVPLSVMDIFVMPSYFEAFGLIALQAMACGVPVIATAKGSIDEIIPSNEYGIKVTPKNSSMISEAVIKLLGDKELSTSIQQKAYQRVKDVFDEKKYFQDLIKEYKQ
jgi:glycosyltransferase involved in cell wall biosynthesis